MPDREKVINHLQIIRTWAVVDRNYGGINPDCCEDIVKWIDDALELLKEQEPVKVEKEYSKGNLSWWHVCGGCHAPINPNDKYCNECGRPVKWDEAD